MEKFHEIKVSPTLVQLRVRPQEGGHRANLNDIQKELKELGVDYRVDHLFDIYRRSSNEFETLASRESTTYELLVTISPESHDAHLTVVAPSKGSDTLTPAKIKDALEAAHVEKGIRYDAIKAILAGKISKEPVLIAKGQAAANGQDGRIEFNPENETDASAAVGHNRVDYKEMNLVKSVQEGHVIARVFPPTEGVNGFTVTGKELKGSNGKRARFKLGPNAELSEDGTMVMAKRAGFVVFNGERISVEDVMEVRDVNAESGNIRFAGVVRIHGQVEDNFTVEAEQGIEISGTVGKATLTSQGEIKVTGGCFGAKIESGKSVSAKFFSECDVQAVNDVIANEYILHSTVQAGRVVQVAKGGSGFVNGGLTRAGRAVVAAVLGSEASEEPTQVEVGVGFNLRKQFDALHVEIERNAANFDKIRKNIRVLQRHKEVKHTLPADNEEALERMITAGQGLRGALLDSIGEHQRLFTALADEGSDEGYVLASSVANGGTRIRIKRLRMALTSPLEVCGFRIQHDELKVQDFTSVHRAYRATYGRLPV